LDKVHLIAGDVLKLGLGISEEDLKLINNVSVVFHVAASVRFDDPLKKAILLNTRGTHEMIKLALKMKKLVSFVYVSTTYFNPSEKNIEEKTYKLDYDWRNAIAAAENYDENFMDSIADL
jgi:alcohol-forming fatty acyl-CoA reductase